MTTHEPTFSDELLAALAREDAEADLAELEDAGDPDDWPGWTDAEVYEAN